MLMTKYIIDRKLYKFDLIFKSNLTLVNGESGVGKSFIFNYMLNDALVNKKKIRCLDYRTVVNGDIDVYSLIKSNKGFVYVIDNADILLDSKTRLYMSLDERNQYIVFIHDVNGFKPEKNSFVELRVKNGIGYFKYLFGG